MKRSRTHSLLLATEISITPLLDLAFILLFAFIVAAPLIADKELLSLPVGNSSPVGETPEAITVLTLLATDAFEWNGELLPQAELISHASAAVAQTPDLGVIVQLDRNRPVQDLVRVMAALNAAGVQRTAIQVQGNLDAGTGS